MLFVSYGLSNVYNIFVGFEIGVVYASENTDVAGMFCDGNTHQYMFFPSPNSLSTH